MDLPQGIYCDVPSWFKNNADRSLDFQANKEHIRRLAQSQVAGLVVMGRNSQSGLLSRTERNEVTHAIVRDFSNFGNHGPIIISTFGAKTKEEAIEKCLDGHKNGATFALVDPPTDFSHPKAGPELRIVFQEVADISMIPVIINESLDNNWYIEDWEELVEACAQHRNIIGMQCSSETLSRFEQLATKCPDFKFFGPTDCIHRPVQLPEVHGAITGIANFAPRVCNLTYKRYRLTSNEIEPEINLSVAEGIFSEHGMEAIKYAMMVVLSLNPSSLCKRQDFKPLPSEIAALVQDTAFPVYAWERILNDVDL